MKALIALSSVVLSTPTFAGDLVLAVTGPGGSAVVDAVVTVYPASGVPKGSIYQSSAPIVRQQNIKFIPGTLIVPVGATVGFPNFDRVRHHVYSFSKAARFELKLYGKDQTRSYTFPVEGAVALGCNIHDTMRGFIKVVGTPYAAKTDTSGRVTITGLPAGRAKVLIWHPLLKAADNETATGVTITAKGAVSRVVPLQLRVAS